ncbi:DNA polymerase IV 2 (plasmid) [Paenibacillus larvae subsp. larvae]|uniref:DNA polymerase IV 2 n=1 Tax=Paenibacillus larvae subsp. larvae TaxID=147375 RepID=A0A2L1U7Q8_9BACL|nr:DNA polymerase IV 2 [Paenibacillus larvae subsp. larvae]
MFGSPTQIAKNIQSRVWNETGVYTRIGISENKILAKMACDNFAKKNKNGIFYLPKTEIEQQLWPLPIHNMFYIGSRMTRHLKRMGIHTIGDLARTSLPRLQKRWGINGEIIWRIANGLDDSPVTPDIFIRQKGIGHQMTLPRDYLSLKELHVPMLELSELVCQRCRSKGYMGQVVSVGCQGADFDHPTGFHRQMKLEDPTNLSNEVYQASLVLFKKHWDGLPVRKISVSLEGLVRDDTIQLTFFEDRMKKLALEKALDGIKDRFGNASIMRAASITGTGQAKELHMKIGGHYR